MSARTIDLEQSFRGFLADVTQKDEAGVEEIIRRAAEQPTLILPGVDELARKELAPRECECLALVGSGMTNSEVARSLHIGVETVKDRLRKANKKLGAKNATHAVVLALALGLLDMRGVEL